MVRLGGGDEPSISATTDVVVAVAAIVRARVGNTLDVIFSLGILLLMLVDISLAILSSRQMEHYVRYFMDSIPGMVVKR